MSRAQFNSPDGWMVYRDSEIPFRISYPPTWVIAPPAKSTARLTIHPTKGLGSCSVLAREVAEARTKTQAELNRGVRSAPLGRAAWAKYMSFPISKIRVVESRIGQIQDIPAVMGILEITRDDILGDYTRKEVVAMTYTPGVSWTLNCGVATRDVEDAAAEFAKLEPTFKAILESLAFGK